ncbi:DNA primase large subunit [Pancytospora epiphaga]|nr:DNA primase large subunit [Pancytospora epiphaga]
MKRLSCTNVQEVVLSFYTGLPIQKLNYEDFKKKAADRLKVLRCIEANMANISSIKDMDEDLTGHACLKLICSQNRWTSSWFVNMEARLFRIRLEKDLFTTRQFFQKHFWPHVLVEEHFQGIVGPKSVFNLKANNSHALLSCSRVHFTKCSDLLARRAYGLHKGYVPFNDDVMKSWMVCEFKKVIERKIHALNVKFTTSPDERFEKLVNELFSETHFSGGSAKDALEKEILFPLCMRGILDKLRKDRHLKYNDRQALCLFLKDVGVQLHDTVNLFRTHFNASLDQFNKNYLYSIRHNYGLEGRGINYKSFTCAKLIGMTSDSNTFGCPFVKNKAYVSQHIDIEDIGKDIQSCCAKVGAKYAGEELDGIFISPADYFRLSEEAASSSFQTDS